MEKSSKTCVLFVVDESIVKLGCGWELDYWCD